MGILCWSLVEETPRCLRLSLLSAWQLLLLVSQKLKLMLTLTCSMVDMDWDILATTIPMLDMDMVMDILVTMARGLLMLSPKLMLILIFFMADITDSDMLDTTTLPMDMLLITARGLLMPSPKLILIFSMVVTMDLVDTVVMADMDLDIVSTMDKQRISLH